MTTEFIPGIEDLSHVQENCDSESVRGLDAEAESRTWSVLPTPSSFPTPSRREVADFGDEGYLLDGVLTADECQHYVLQGDELGFGEIPGATRSYRNCQRIMLNCPEMASTLWERIQDQLTDVEIQGDAHTVHVHGVSPLIQGCWRPHRLNHLFRLCRYESGGHFAPHYDGHLVVDSQERSMKTFMIYLNEDFTGGDTRFVDDGQTLYQDKDGRYCAEEENILHSVRPRAGTAIIFNHHRLHEGQRLSGGVKYILRTDIMYRRQGGAALDPQEEEALRLVQDAERLEGLGESMEAMKLYRKAFKLSPALESSY